MEKRQWNNNKLDICWNNSTDGHLVRMNKGRFSENMGIETETACEVQYGKHDGMIALGTSEKTVVNLRKSGNSDGRKRVTSDSVNEG